MKGRPDVGSRLIAPLLMELGIGSPAFKEVEECLVEMPQGLLQGHTGNLIQPGALRLFLELGEQSRGIARGEALLLLVVGIRSQRESPVVDETSTAKSASKDLFLLISWIHSILVGSFLVHVLYHSTYCVACQHFAPCICRLKAASLLALFYRRVKQC